MAAKWKALISALWPCGSDEKFVFKETFQKLAWKTKFLTTKL